MNYQIQAEGRSFPLFRNVNASLPLEHKKTMALVASSGGLLETKYGQEIDAHDLVLRYNAAPVKGFEKHVGSRTDIRLLNGHAFNASTNGPCAGQEKNKLLLPTLTNETFIVKSFVIEEFYEGVLSHVNKNPLNFLHPAFMAHCCDGLVSVPEATCGLVGVVLALSLGLSPTLYGYGFYGEPHDKMHYWEEVMPTWTIGHDTLQEKTILEEWAREKRITIKYSPKPLE